MKHTMILLAMVAFALGLMALGADEKAPSAEGIESIESAVPVVAPKPPRHIDLAICLDTSNSMDGLIGAAKQKLWAIVNELALARPRPVFRVALYQYGNDSLNRETGWVQQVCELTGDLDTVYGKLFALKTNGGTEYVSRVIRAATENLKWTTQKNALRIIVVAGNETAIQDKEYNLRDVCHATAGKGIIINTVFCGNVDEGKRTGWSDAAGWADGRYAAIDQNNGTIVIQTPYDKKISKLGKKLNVTYVPYGQAGKAGLKNQSEQDANAATLGAPASAERAAAKAGGLYSNGAWDLVDAAAKGKDFDIAKVDEKDLPENMQKMTVEQRKAYIEKQGKLRAGIQKEIQTLNAKREARVRKEMEKKGLDESKAFDAVLRSAIREQAQKKEFRFEEQSSPAAETE